MTAVQITALAIFVLVLGVIISRSFTDLRVH